MSNRVITGNLSPVPNSFQQIALSSTVPSNLSPPVGAQGCRIDVEVQNARYRDDGGAPSSTAGMRILADTGFDYTGDLTKVKFIAEVGGSIINVSYYW